jgi:hypothetical protein
MTKKSSPVLTDAVIVISAHEQLYWELLCNSYRIALPATILEDEVFYFQVEGRKQGLAPSQWIAKGNVERLEAEVGDYENLSSKLSKHFMNSLDPGELEALALLGSKNYKDYLFTTADRAAIKALGVLGWGARGISVETLLEHAGWSASMLKKLPRNCTKRWFDGCVQEGFMEKHLWLK